MKNLHKDTGPKPVTLHIEFTPEEAEVLRNLVMFLPWGRLEADGYGTYVGWNELHKLLGGSFSSGTTFIRKYRSTI